MRRQHVCYKYYCCVSLSRRAVTEPFNVLWSAVNAKLLTVVHIRGTRWQVGETITGDFVEGLRSIITWHKIDNIISSVSCCCIMFTEPRLMLAKMSDNVFSVYQTHVSSMHDGHKLLERYTLYSRSHPPTCERPLRWQTAGVCKSSQNLNLFWRWLHTCICSR